MRLRELREARGWTQLYLAKKCGFQQSAVGHWEAGRREPSLTNAIRLANALGVALDDLCGLGWPKNEVQELRAKIKAALDE